MRVFVAGASGALGTRIVARLIDRGHEVIGSYRSAGHEQRVMALGARTVQLDLRDASAVVAAVRGATPDVIVHQATALADARFGRHLDRTFAATNQLRTVGTDALLAAAQAAGVRRFVAQSYAPYRYAREGGPVKTEDDPIEATPPPAARETFAAMSHLDAAVTGAGGVALRYGTFYGDTDPATKAGLLDPVRKRRYPLVAGGRGIMSFIHLEDAADATVCALEQGSTGIFNIVDDEPAPMREWVPVLAAVLGAKPPLRVPAWAARLVAGSDAVAMISDCRGASNAKARRELGWVPRYSSWREGFPAAYGA
ncbi:MAG TPA: NAD(P)-dependent oxidoreductase [Micromonosporaceae bacterium]|jgi:nucleoside-diphosphate-sugar epimerase